MLDRPHRRLDVAVARDHDHRQRRRRRSRSRASVSSPSMPGSQTSSSDEVVRGAPRARCEARLAALHRLDGVALVAQDARRARRARPPRRRRSASLLASPLPLHAGSSTTNRAPARRVVLDPDRAAVLLDDAAHDREAEAAAPPLGREVRARRACRGPRAGCPGRRRPRRAATRPCAAVVLGRDHDPRPCRPSPRSRCRPG